MRSLPKDRIISSMHNISTLLTQHISVENAFESIAKEISHAFGLTRLIIFLVNKDKNLIENQHTYGFNPQEAERAKLPYRMNDHDCVETRVAKTGKYILIKDYEKDSTLTKIDIKVSRIMSRVSSITVPLKIKEDIIGMISADKGDAKLNLSDKDIHTFLTFANQASIIIENIRLQEQNKKKIIQLLDLQKAGNDTSSTHNIEELSKIITERALQLSNASICSLFIRDDEQQEMERAFTSKADHEAHQMDTWFIINKNIINQVAETGKIFMTCNEDKNGEPKSACPTAIQSLLALPLISEQQVFGVLALGTTEKKTYPDDDLNILTIFASHAASTIKNARFYSQIITEKILRENILESSPSGMISIDRSKQISSVNRRAEEIFSIKRADALGAHPRDIFGDKVSTVIEQAIDQHKIAVRKEIRRKNSSGETIILGLTSSLLRNHQGGLVGALLIVRDLTNEKKKDALIRRFDRLASLGQFSAGIAHEIRNPLASIYFNVQLLGKKLTLPPDAQELLTDTCKGIDRIRNLVKGMLDYAKPAQPALEQGSILRILKETITLMDLQLKKKKIVVALRPCDTLPDIILDAHQIQQVFVNLLLNSMEAMADGGIITIGVDKEIHEQHRQIVLRFHDQGEGVAAELIGKIFDPFFTTKTKGTGLGLSIVHKILEQHNATIEVFSNKNSGTTFVLRFPIANSEVIPCIDTKF